MAFETKSLHQPVTSVSLNAFLYALFLSRQLVF